MAEKFGESELIINDKKRVYHLDVDGESIADDILIVGDPNRVEKISALFSKIDFKTEHREFITHTGWFNGKRMTVTSSGIGTDNIDIVLNELDAAANINLHDRTLNAEHRTLNLIRLGTSGALQAEIPVNSLVVSEYGLGMDGLLNYYANWNDIDQADMAKAFIQHTNWGNGLPYPYIIKGAETLLNQFKTGNHVGITATAPGFYGPQGRQIRLKAAKPDLNDLLTSFNFNGNKITNFEMETSAIYGLGRLLGHNPITICVIIANRIRKEFTSDYQNSVKKLITDCLERLTS
jgi:uridine phosphorylase